MAPLLRAGLLLLLGAHFARAELKLLHVLSANKFYVPDFDQSSRVFQPPKNLSYEYFVRYSEDVPNSVKMHLYNLGVFLRNTYGSFLGDLYHNDIITMQTTEFAVSIIAGELINAGLWPPTGPQIWNNDLLWQPVPFVYLAAEGDTLLLGSLCPNFEYDTHHVLEHHQDLNTNEKDLLNFIHKEGHIHVENLIDASLLYLAIQNSMEMNQTQPEWVKKIDGDLTNITLKAYQYLAHSALQRRLNGGSLLKTIVEKSKAYIRGALPVERKIDIYSGDDRVFAGLLGCLKIPFFELPQPGAAMIFELIEIDNHYFIKLNYYMGSSGKETIPYQIEGCDLLCPIDQFENLVADYLPLNELSLCGSIVNEDESTAAATNVFSASSVILCYLLSVISLAKLTSV